MAFAILVLVLMLLKNCELPQRGTGPGGRGMEGDLDTSFFDDPDSVEDTVDTLSGDALVESSETDEFSEAGRTGTDLTDADRTDTIDEVHMEFAGSKKVGEGDYVDTLYVYADPWGGRHFDSVKVELFCRGSCDLVYSFKDGSNLNSYHHPLMIKSDKTLWIAGINEKGEQSKPIKVKYVIERKRGKCPGGMMPFSLERNHHCIDVYEWPNLEGEVPKSFVSHKEAASLCRSVNKRLCSIDEWQAVCLGPDNLRYPYGNQYDENFCPAKEKKVKRTGRYPACRSYYGAFDMSGNLWEWTASPSEPKAGHYWVAGGNWEAGNQATCKEKKYSFYPQNKYPFVGFRCCKDI